MFSLRFSFVMLCNSFVNLLRFAIDICVTEALLIQQGCRIRRGQLGGREMHFCKFPQVHHKQRHYGRSCQGFCCPCTSCGNHRMILDVFVLTSNSNRRFRSQTDQISLDFSHPGCISEGRLASTISLHWERAHEILFFLLAGAIARKFQARVNRGWTEVEQRLDCPGVSHRAFLWYFVFSLAGAISRKCQECVNRGWTEVEQRLDCQGVSRGGILGGSKEENEKEEGEQNEREKAGKSKSHL